MAISSTTTVLVAVEPALFRVALSHWITATLGYRVVAQAADVPGVVEAVALHRPSVVVMGTLLGEQPTFATGRDLQRTAVRVVYVAQRAQDRDIASALDSGSQWVICAQDSPEEVSGVFQAALSNVAGHTASVRARLAAGARTHGHVQRSTKAQLLSARQCEVLRYIAGGMSKREVAEKMEISPRTVERHVANIMASLDIHDRVHLTRFAIREGLVEI